MTTLIDRIMNKIEIDHTGKWADDMIAIKKILEAELTAVNGVDELVDKCDICQNNKATRLLCEACYDYVFNY